MLDTSGDAAGVVESAMRSLDQLVQRLEDDHGAGVAAQAGRAVTRVRAALVALVELLQGRRRGKALLEEPATSFPQISLDAARLFLDATADIATVIEHDVLDRIEPLERDSAKLEDIKRAIGAVWGWLMFDIEEPLHQQHPGLRPEKPGSGS
jgi:hypothetical protein